MPHKSAASSVRLTAAVVAIAAVLLLGGCASDSPDAQAAAAAAKPLSQEAFITRQLTLSNSDFAAYVRQQGARLSAGTDEFVQAYDGGDDQLARSLYAPTRVFYNRMLAVSDTFPEVDASLDGPASGWHAIERDLFGGGAPLAADQRRIIGQQLNDDTAALSSHVAELRPSLDQQTEGIAALLSGRATAAASGGQELFSHTDLYDLQGYVDGAREVFDGIRPILVTENAALATTLDHRFDAIEGQLNGVRTGLTFPSFDTLSDDQARTLRSALADLTESFSLVTPTMTPGPG